MIDKDQLKCDDFYCNEKIFVLSKIFKITDFISESLKLLKSKANEVLTVRMRIWNYAIHFTCMISSTSTSPLRGRY